MDRAAIDRPTLTVRKDLPDFSPAPERCHLQFLFPTSEKAAEPVRNPSQALPC